MIGHGHRLWIATGRGQGKGVVVAYDLPAHRVIVRRRIPPQPTAIALQGKDVWVAVAGSKLGQGRLVQLDSARGARVRTVRGLDFPDAVAAGPTALWASGQNGDLWRIDLQIYASYRVTRFPSSGHLQTIRKRFMWTLGAGVQERNPATGKVISESQQLCCEPAALVATQTRAWVIHPVQVSPPPQPEGPVALVPMLSSFSIPRNEIVGLPIPVVKRQPLEDVLFKFGSVWVSDPQQVMKVGPAALACQLNPTCERAHETRYRPPGP